MAEYDSMPETGDLLADDEALADLRQSRADFAAGDTFSADDVDTELARHRDCAHTAADTEPTGPDVVGRQGLEP